MHNPHIIRKVKYRLNLYNSSPFKILRNILLSILIISTLTTFIFRIEKRLFSLAERVAFSDLQNLISKEANLCIRDVLKENNINLNSVISSEYIDKSTSALSTDFSDINLLKTEVSDKLTSYIRNNHIIDCKIPSMALISDGPFSGYGFKIPIKLITTGSAFTDFSHDFSYAGSNQSKYTLSLKVTVNVELQTVFSERKSVFTTTIPLAEKIIIGDSPDLMIGSD